MAIGKDVVNLQAKLNDDSPEHYQQIVLKRQLEQSKKRWGLINQSLVVDTPQKIPQELINED